MNIKKKIFKFGFYPKYPFPEGCAYISMYGLRGPVKFSVKSKYIDASFDGKARLLFAYINNISKDDNLRSILKDIEKKPLLSAKDKSKFLKQVIEGINYCGRCIEAFDKRLPKTEQCIVKYELIKYGHSTFRQINLITGHLLGAACVVNRAN